MTVDGNVLLPEEAAFVSSAREGHLATVYPDGDPHVVPISTVLVLNRLLFASDRATQKVRNIEGNPFVAISFDEYHEDWSQLVQVVIHGEAYVLDAGFEYERDRTLLYEKFTQYEALAPIEDGVSVIVEVRIDRATSTWRDPG
jgi:nitroimidazol reductase NimA-like FMN-containing flavoprotein (pyridoxamine 5'-phosphate oxidase superfamily)